MAVKSYTTSLTVQFTSGSENDAIFTAEVDDREAGLNGGDNNFTPGMNPGPGVLVFKSLGVTIDSIRSSSGNLSYQSSGSYDVEEYVEFSDTKVHKLNKPITGSFIYKWVGVDGGVVSNNGNTLTLIAKVVGVLKITYTSNYSAYRLNNVPSVLNGETEFPVVVVISGSS